MRFQTIIVSVILILLALTACRDKVTVPYVKSIWLSAEDIGVTDAFIHVILSNDNKSSSFLLKLNGKTILSANARDTLIFSDSLLPKHTYTYRAYRLNGAIIFDSSDALKITTMDTTSHNFTWLIDTLGDGSSSVLYDVAIINDTLVYAVGEIYLRDSLGQLEPTLYNLAVWNGKAWNIIRVPYYYQGQPFYNAIQAVYAFVRNDIWFAGNGVIRWNGQQYIPMEIPSSVWGPNRINKIWGSSSSDLYIVGDNGSIAHYDGLGWQRLESGTSAGLFDVWGHADLSTGHATILSVASSAEETKILSLSGVAANDTLAWPPSERLSGIYMSNAFTVYVSNAGVWRHNNSGWKQTPGLPQNIFFTGVRGTAENNLFAIAWRGMLAHSNGVGWRVYTEISADYNFDALAVSQNLIVAVGFTGGLFADKAVAIIGRRIQ